MRPSDEVAPSCDPPASRANGREQSEAFDSRRRPFDPFRVTDRATEHLVTAAQSKDKAAAAHMSSNVNVKAGAAQRRKVGNG